MTKEQYSRVERFKPQFNQAKSNFVRICKGDLEIIRNVYNEVYSQNLQPSNLNCNSCVLKMMKKMAEAVENYEQWYEKRFGKAKPTSQSKRNSDIPEQNDAE